MSGIDSSAPASPDSALLVNFSVHSLPSTRDATLRRSARGRWTMIAVLLVCAAPVIASFFTYFVVAPRGHTNYSELITPPRPLPASLPLADLAGAPVAPLSLRGQWLVIVVSGGACDGRCERYLWLQRQLHEAIGAEKDRVDKVWLVDDGVAPRAETLASDRRDARARHRLRADDGPARRPRAARRLARARAGAGARGSPLPRRSARRLDDASARRPGPRATEARRRQAAARLCGMGSGRTVSAATTSVDLAPLLGLLALGAAIAAVPLAVVLAPLARRRAGASSPGVRVARALPQLRPGPARRLHAAQRLRPRLPRLAGVLRPCQPRGRGRAHRRRRGRDSDRAGHGEQGLDRDAAPLRRDGHRRTGPGAHGAGDPRRAAPGRSSRRRLGDRDAALDLSPGRVRCADRDVAALPGDRHAAPARRRRPAGPACGPGRALCAVTAAARAGVAHRARRRRRAHARADRAGRLGQQQLRGARLPRFPDLPRRVVARDGRVGRLRGAPSARRRHRAVTCRSPP